jgi:hypothetical protein
MTCLKIAPTARQSSTIWFLEAKTMLVAFTAEGGSEGSEHLYQGHEQAKLLADHF